MQESVLVTGGAGYVGSIVVAELLSRGYRVRVLDALLHGSTPSLLQSWGNPSFEFIHADVRDPAARATAVQGVNAEVLGAPTTHVPGEVFNVGDTRENYQKLDIVSFLRERFPNGKVEFVQRDEDPRDYRVSFDKFGGRFNFAAERSVSDGIDEVIGLLASGLVPDPFAPAYRN